MNYLLSKDKPQAKLVCKASVKTKICKDCEHNKEHEYIEECSVRCKAHYEHCKCAHKIVHKS